jgi:phenylpropionate dioxygenase-like ring-hydroxylating dioxygenase large terminal subunit
MDDSCPHRLSPLSEGRINRITSSETSSDSVDDDSDKKKGKNKGAEISSIASTSLQCSYHGWEYDGLNNGQCIGIPQISEQEKLALLSSSSNSNRACVKSYSTIVHKNILWFWPWKLDSLSILGQHKKYPEGMMESISINAIPSTYTRDLPYGWDTLVENLIDPAHIPFAHHNLQGKRKDAIPIYMSIPESFPNPDTDTVKTTDGGSKNKNDGDGETGFYFEWSDRTSKC